MRKPMIWMLTGMVLGSLITTPVIAGAEILNVAVSQVKLMINGIDKTPANGGYWNGSAQVPIALEYQGTTYVPIRYVSEALGVPVDWEGGSRTIFVGSKPSDHSVQKVSMGRPVHPEPNSPVTFTPLSSVMYDAGDSNLIKVSVAVRNDGINSFSVGYYQSQFTSKDGSQFSGTLYLPQGSDDEVAPKTTRILQYYATIPKGIAGSDVTLQLTKIDFSTYPAQFIPWVSVHLQTSSETGASYMVHDNPVFDLTPYKVQVGEIVSWSYDSKALTQVYRLHVTTTKDPDVNTFPNANELIFELVDGDGESVAQTRYAIGASSNQAVPVIGDGDQYITYSNLPWSRYNSSGTKMRVWEAFGQGKRLLGTFTLN